jgi:hypothetical protein
MSLEPSPIQINKLIDHLLIFKSTEPLYVEVSGAQESIMRNRFRQVGNRFMGSLKVLQIRARAIWDVLLSAGHFGI